MEYIVRRCSNETHDSKGIPFSIPEEGLPECASE